MEALQPEPKRSTLGRFRPEKPMRGPWLSLAALGSLLLSMVMESLFLSLVPAIAFDTLAIYLAWRGRLTRGRALAWIVLYASVGWTFAILTAHFWGREIIGGG